nr:fumarylacetoacetate hydrolase family protein [Roseivivax isoporae]
MATLAGPDGAGLVVGGRDGALHRATARDLTAALEAEEFGHAGVALDAPDRAAFRAPLPWSHTFLDGSAYVNHVDLVRRARGAPMPERFWTDPLMYQGCAVFEGPVHTYAGDPGWGIDFEGEVAVICGPVARGATEADAARAIRFVMLLNDISLRNLIPDELSKGFGFVQSKPPSQCSAFAVSVDALPGWDGLRLHGTLVVTLNGAEFGRLGCGEDMTFDFPRLVAHAARTRALPAGAVIGSGTVSNRDADAGPGRPRAEGGRGYACIAEQRMVETLLHGAPRTRFLQPGDHVEMHYLGPDGQSPFGGLEMRVAAP